MRYNTHILFAITFVLPLYKFFSEIPLVSYLFIASFASLTPDLDHPKAFASRSSFASKIIRFTTKHRGWTHSLFGLLLFSSAFVLVLHYIKLSVSYAIPFFLGYVSHLISDSLNPTGVMWFWPNKRWLGVGLISTGSKREKLFRLILIVALIFTLYFSITENPIYF